MRPRASLLLPCAVLLAGLCTAVASAPRFELPPGYAIDVYAPDVPNARQMAFAKPGLLFVGSRELGAVHAVIDADGDASAERVEVIASGLQMPSGVAWRNGALYVAEVHRILRFDDIERRLERPGRPVVVYDALPSERHHGWKFIAFGPDGRLFVPVGAPCNVCEPPSPFASLLSMTASGEDVRVEARGVRNSVGFDFHPRTGELWFTDNGRDWLGDDRPPCELNRLSARGAHFGFPYVHGDGLPDPDLGAGRDAAEFVAPALALGAHVAPLGIEFYRGTMFPAAAGDVLFVAEHGSWNRSRKAGYRVMRAVIDDAGAVVEYAPFVTGWLRGQATSGRPADLEMLPDGSLLVSDDDAGRIYRVTWAAP